MQLLKWGQHSIFRYAFKIPRQTRNISLAWLLTLGLLVALPEFALADHIIVEYPTSANTSYSNITAGADGNIWFTESSANKIGKITPDGVLNEYPIPTPNTYPRDITAGPDGNIWFTESNPTKIGKVTPSGIITEYPVPTPSASTSITSGPDGNLWFTELEGQKIGKITPAGVVTEFTVPFPNSYPALITAGPDGNIWFSDGRSNKISRVTTAGVFSDYDVLSASTSFSGLTNGPDGNIWFTEYYNGIVGKVSPAGIVTEYIIPTPNVYPTDIATGPDGNLWFIEEGAKRRIGKVTPGGVFTEYDVPDASATPFAITGGPDGNIWFTEIIVNKVAKLILDHSSTANQPSSKPAAQPADIVAQLRVKPDRFASTDPTNLISYTLSLKNIGSGKANSASVRFPIDPNLMVGYAADLSDSRMWVSAIVTNVPQPYIQINLPSLDTNVTPLTLTLVFRPAANAQAGASIFTRYQVLFDDDTGSGKQQISNAERFSLSSDGNRDDTGGAVELFNPATASVAVGSKLTIGGDFYIPNEIVSLWYTGKDGTSVALGQQTADKDGKLSFDFVAGSDLKAGETYTVVGYGNHSGVSGSSVVTVASNAS